MAVDFRTAKADSEPTWEIAYLFPSQGAWSEPEYLGLQTNRCVEYSDGNLEVLAMPGERHQRIVLFLLQLLAAHVQSHRLGTVLMAPFPVRLWPGKFREPDIVFLHADHDDRRHEQYWDGADLVIEVVSPDDPNRDLVTKRDEYARAGIAEYWIVDRRPRTITVLTLEDGGYNVHGVFAAGERAQSVLLAEFSVAVAEVFADND